MNPILSFDTNPPIAAAKPAHSHALACQFNASIIRRTIRNLPAIFLVGLVLFPYASCVAETSDAKMAFDKSVVPFVKNYCVECHGEKRSKAGLNPETALTNPGSAAGLRLWKKALAHVKAHHMPPEDADKLPTAAELRQFQDAIGQIKFLSPKDPGLFVIRRLTKVELGNTLRDLIGVDPKIVAA